MKKIITSLFTILTFTSFLYADFKTINNKDLETAIKSGIPVIDIRRSDEWKETGVVPSSHKLTFFKDDGSYDLLSWIKEFKKIVISENTKFVLDSFIPKFKPPEKPIFFG